MAVAVTGLWTGRNGYRVTRSDTGQSVTHFIAGTKDEMQDQVWLGEWGHKLRETTASEWGLLPVKAAATRDQQHDFGAVLKEITASNRRRSAQLGHGRWY